MKMALLKASVTEETNPKALPLPDSVIGAHDQRPLDWGHVVDAAAARLDESWVRPDNTGHMLASGLAEELAATLCAYGMVAKEVDHMHDHEGAHPAVQPPLQK